MNAVSLADYISNEFEGVDVLADKDDRYFYYDPRREIPHDRRMPFATLMTTDAYDSASNLCRPGVFRLNIGVSRATFQRVVGSTTEPDYAAFDRLLPHPVYARQLWISILNPGDATFRDVVLSLLTEAHDRLAAQRARHRIGEPQ